jgi:hypothetical protein
MLATPKKPSANIGTYSSSVRPRDASNRRNTVNSKKCVEGGGDRQIGTQRASKTKREAW